MTLPSQFSLEEENFYKDIQDLLKKGSQNEKELSSFLQRYMDLLARADLDDETFIINFTKAGLIIEASAKVYGTKVDRLWINLEHVLESLKNRNQGCKKKTDCEYDGGDDIYVDGCCYDGQEEGRRKLAGGGRRRRKVGDTLMSSDDFVEIDNISEVLGKNVNETSNISEDKLKLCEKVPNMFIKNKTKKKKTDVCLNKCIDDKDVIRLRDWIITTEGLLVKEPYTPLLEITDSEERKDTSYYEAQPFTDDDAFENVEEENLSDENLKDEKNNNTEVRGISEENLREPAVMDKLFSSNGKDIVTEEFDISKESDVAKFPNVLNRLSEDCLVDVDEVFWNSTKFQDVISSKKMRAGKTNKLPCQLCAEKKDHKKKGRRCMEERKLNCLDSYFTPHVQPTLPEPHFGIILDVELFNIFKVEMKVIEHLGKVNSCKNINEAYHPDERPEELRNFLGFDGFENFLMKRTSDLQEEEEEEEVLEDNLLVDPQDGNDNYVEDSPPEKEFELPFPTMESSIKTTFLQDNEFEENANEILANSEAEYQKLVIEELKDHYAAKTSFAKNKELGIRISKWHEMIADKIMLSQQRGALNMKYLAEKIMRAFPVPSAGEHPVMDFKDLVQKQNRRDIPRYFFACLQLTNEGNLNIGKSNPKPLATDCMVITRLRTTRINCELEESTKSPSKNVNSPSLNKRKINSYSNSAVVVSENEIVCKKKKTKERFIKSSKRPKNFNSTNESKKRRYSISSVDSVMSIESIQ